MKPTGEENAPLGVSVARLKVVVEHAEEAAFLWTHRDRAVDLPHYDLFSLARLDKRVEAHLDGLRVAGETGWDVARTAAKSVSEPGEIFTAAVLAFEEIDPQKSETVLALAATDSKLGRAVVSALGWVPYVQSGPWIRTLLASETPLFQSIGLSAIVAHRKNPGAEILSRALGSSNNRLKARALRAIGELGLVDMHLALRAQLKSSDPLCRYQAAWSLALLQGHPDALAHLQQVGEAGGPNALEAAALAGRRSPQREARLWLMKLVREKNLPRVAIAVASGLGEPEAIPWLLDQCKIPAMARPAGEAFCMITGADLERDQLIGEKPEDFESGPTDNPDDKDVAIDPDEDLPWPSLARLKGWWNVRKGGYTKETRYLMGRPITRESLRHVLKTGYQRQRAASALESAILKPGRPLHDVRAPGFVQQAIWNLPD